MKKVFALSLAITFILIFSVSVCDTDTKYSVKWPPENYDMPRTVFTTEVAERSLSGLSKSMKSLSGTGLKVMGIMISFSLISVMFRILFLNKLDILDGVRHNEFRRKVSAEDRKRNLDQIVDEQVDQMEVGYLAKKRFRFRHPNIDLEEAIYHREISAQADLEFSERNPQLAIDCSVVRRQVSAMSDKEFYLRDPDAAVDGKIAQRMLNYEAEGIYRMRNIHYVVQRKVDDQHISDQAHLVYKDRFPKIYHQRRSRRSY